MIRLPSYYRESPAPESLIKNTALELREKFINNDNDRVNIKAIIESFGGSVSNENILGSLANNYSGFPVTICFREGSFITPYHTHNSISRDRIYNTYGLAGYLFSDNKEPHIVTTNVLLMNDSINKTFWDDANLFLNELLMPEDNFIIDYKKELKSLKNRTVEDRHVITMLRLADNYHIQNWVIKRRAIELKLLPENNK